MNKPNPDQPQPVPPLPTPDNRKRRPWEKAFLYTLNQVGNVTTACEKAGITRQGAYEFKDNHPDFAAEWEDALDAAADRLETEALRRAVTGTEEPVYQGGEKVGTIRKYSDTLLIFLLKGIRPAKYAHFSKVEHSGPGGGPIEVSPAARVAQRLDELAERRERKTG